MKSTFTPGPWEYKEWKFSPVDGWIIQNHQENIKEPLTYVGTVRRRINSSESEANARLIAAAPELLGACQMMLWSEENGEAEAQRQGKPRYSERVEILRNIIAKATGEKEKAI